MSEKTLNKGEWSEYYAFLRILEEGQLVGCDADLNRVADEAISVREVHCQQALTKDDLVYRLFENANNVTVLSKGVVLNNLCTEGLKEAAAMVLGAIKGSSATFAIPNSLTKLSDLHSPKLKAASQSKRDITIKVYDPFTNTEPEHGFSIKSNLAGKATLLNSSAATNFIYRIDGDMSDAVIDELNSLKVKKLIAKLQQMNRGIDFSAMERPTYHNNLQHIDSKLPEIAGQMLLDYYCGKARKISELIPYLEESNVACFDKKSLYGKKVSDFLFATAFGMTPARPWSGGIDADGGCIVVKNDGELVTFYIPRQNLKACFKEYIISKCYLDTPSASRHKFGSIYKDNGQLLIKLNLQIRFE
jgi:hypothetical protein